MTKLGIDVSRWQGSINWDSVKQTDVGFAILKAGGSDAGLYVDPTFEHNYKECKRLGIPVGCYYFVGYNCTSTADGLADAEQFLGIIREKQFEYPVYLDYEAPSPANKQGNTDAAIAFCDESMVLCERLDPITTQPGAAAPQAAVGADADDDGPPF